MGDLRLQYTVDEALSTIGYGKFHVFALIFAGLGWCGDAIQVMLLSIVQPAIQSEWRLSPGEESMLTSVVFTGTLIGGCVWGLISDAYGRPGSWIIATSSFWAAGTIFEASLAWIIMPRLGWRWLIAFSCLPSFMVLLLAALIPESPRYLCLKDRTTEALQVLEKVAKINQTKLPPGILVSDPLVEHDEECVSSEERPLLSSGRKKSGDSETGISSVFKLFSLKLVKTTILLWLLYFGNLFTYNGLVFMTSELISGQKNCGQRNILSENSQDATSYMEIFIASSAELVSALLLTAVVDRAGRKLLMGIACLLSFIILLALVFHQNDIVMTALLFGARMFIPVGCAILGLYASEFYPTSLRSTGVGVASSVGRIGGILCPIVAVGMLSSCHQAAALITFEVVIFLLGLGVFLLPVETNGRKLSDVVQTVEEEATARIS